MSDTDTAQRAEDLPDDIGPVHQTSGFVETAKTPEHGDLEIGLKNGDGYLKLVPFPNSEVMELTIPRDAVTEFVAKRSEQHPLPTVPDGFGGKRAAPDAWNGGQVRHTGGGLYCRIWRQQTKNGTLEVAYSVPGCMGVTLGQYDTGDAWRGEIDSIQVPEETDDACADAARRLMRAVDEGVYDAQIE